MRWSQPTVVHHSIFILFSSTVRRVAAIGFCQIRLGRIWAKSARKKSRCHRKNCFLNSAKSARHFLHQGKNIPKKNRFWTASRRGGARKCSRSAIRFCTEKKTGRPVFLFCKSKLFLSRGMLPVKQFLRKRTQAARWKTVFLFLSHPNFSPDLQKMFCVRLQGEAFGRDWALSHSMWFSVDFHHATRFTFQKITILGAQKMVSAATLCGRARTLYLQCLQRVKTRPREHKKTVPPAFWKST